MNQQEKIDVNTLDLLNQFETRLDSIYEILTNILLIMDSDKFNPDYQILDKICDYIGYLDDKYLEKLDELYEKLGLKGEYE